VTASDHLPGRWRQQPGPGARLDRSHPLAFGLRWLVVPALGAAELVGATVGTPFGSGITMPSTPGGRGARNAADASSGISWPFTQRLAGITDLTICWQGRADALTGAGAWFSLPVGSAWADPWGALDVAHNSGDPSCCQFELAGSATAGSADGAVSASGFFAADGKVHHWAITRKGAAIQFFRDGALFDSQTLGGGSTNAIVTSGAQRPTILSKSSTAPTEPSSATLLQLGIWARVLAPADIRRLAEAPWALTASPRPAHISALTVASSAVLAVTLTEADVLAATVTTVTVLAATLAETSTLTVTLTTSTILARSFAEADTLSATLTTGNVIARSFAETDTLSAVLTSAATLTATFAESDALSAMATFRTTLTAALTESDQLIVTLGQVLAAALGARVVSRWRTSRHLTSTRTWP
jgi:hypothetical protein